MAKDLNKVQLTGRLGADPEPRFTPQGTAVTTFRVASNRRWKSADGEDHEETEWFRVVVWNKLAEICRDYLRKGSRVYIEGRLQTRSWEDKETGQTKYLTEVVANDMIILDSRRDNGYGNAEPDFEPEHEADPEPAPAPARRAPAPGGSQRPAAANGGQRPPARVSSVPRNKPALDEEDLPF